jgi:hypothetical protein
MVETKISAPWSKNGDANGKYSLWDVYAFADFITYPSLYEGFGNAFLEAVYLKKPILINRYSTFVKDIEPLGFKLPLMDGYVSAKTVQEVKAILESPEARNEMVDHNFEIARHHFSFNVLRNRLELLMRGLLGDEEVCLGCTLKHYRNIIYLEAGKGRMQDASFLPARSNRSNIVN